MTVSIDTPRGAFGSGVALTLARAGLLVALLAGLGWLLRHRLAELDLDDMAAHLGTVSHAAVLGAVVLTLLSHAALSFYDLVAFRQLGLGVPRRAAVVGGFAATTIGQVLGFGLITSSLARWRLHGPWGLTPAQAVAASGLVTAGFFSGLGTLLLALAALAPDLPARLLGWPDGLVRLSALAALGGLALLAAARRRRITARAFGLSLTLPDGTWLLRCTLLATADLVPAALTLWLLLPPEFTPPVVEMLAIYVVALAFGHVSGAPGGFGAFEAVLMLAMPQAPISELAAAVLLYRGIYYGGPFVIALAILARPFAPRAARAAKTAPAASAPPTQAAWILDSAPRAEGALAWLGDKHFFVSAGGDAFVMYGVRGRRWLVLGDPYGPRSAWPELMEEFETAARRARARIAIYKAEDVAFWRARGRWIQPLGEEAALSPANFALDRPERRELRRKLAQVTKAGVTLHRHDPGEAELRGLVAVAAAWAAAKPRGEQTFSMGHFDPGYVAAHRIFAARQGGQMIAFLSVWVSGDGGQWMIDLMRQIPDAPNGTMHALVAEAIAAAREGGAAEFNLCMAPLSGLDRLAPVTPLSRLGALIYTRADARHGLQGLRRFKEMFRPDWHPRYLVANGPISAVLALRAAAALVAGSARPATTGGTRAWWVARAAATGRAPGRRARLALRRKADPRRNSA